MPGRVYKERWEVIESLSEGGQAHIFRVRDLKTGGNNYILKRLKNRDRVERFEREIKAIKSIDSPYVEKIIDYNDTEDKEFYFVMPYTEKTLNDILFDLKGDFIRVLEIYRKICEGIQASHLNEPKVIHRDLKPKNILIDKDDNPKIIDFGLCFLEKSERFTHTQEQVGSRYYIAPECEGGRSEDIKIHTDIYSLGKILYAMISGGKIFPREKQQEDDYNLEKIIPDRRIRYLNQIINKCVKENPSERYKNIEILLMEVKETMNLIKMGFMPPKYRDEICRFCGKGRLQYFGKLKGSILKKGNVTHDISGAGMILWLCPECGNTYIFSDPIYKEHK